MKSVVNAPRGWVPLERPEHVESRLERVYWLVRTQPAEPVEVDDPTRVKLRGLTFVA